MMYPLSKLVLLFLTFLLLSLGGFAQGISVRSPNGRAEIRVGVAKSVSYSIYFDQKLVVIESPIALSVKENAAIGIDPKVIDSKERKNASVVTSIVPTKRRQIRDAYNELTVSFQGNYQLVLRAYDNGVAYRWVTDLPGKITISSETAEININKDDVVFYPQEDEFFSHNERNYRKLKPKDLKTGLGSLPAMVSTKTGVRLWISEADLYDYAGMWLEGTNGKGMRAVFPKVATAENLEGDRNLKVTQRADFIAQTSGKRNFPWRVFGLAANDKDLIDNELVFLLSEPATEDFSWVKPGKVAWDWWNAWNLQGVSFKAGINTLSYKYYIDFASKFGIEYVILDEGWSKFEDPTKASPDVDLPEILRYAKTKNVGIILWAIWIPLDKNMAAIMDKYQEWGVKGIKVDFMQRDDQRVVEFYERTAREAAKRKLMIDFHGAHKPTGLSRKYPNVVSYEGVKGLEHNKFADPVTPEHDVTLPYIRMTAGAMDYTPGAMLNATKKGFQISNTSPMSIGTRAHQLAMYVIYESPLQMLADSPTNYQKEAASMEFLSAVPTVWDETVVIDGRIGEYVVIARKALNGDWYIGAMTNSKERSLVVDLSFLGEGSFDAQIFQDGPNAKKIATDLQKLTQQVSRTTKLNVAMAEGGGFAARLVKK